MIGLLLCLVMVCTLFVGCSEGDPIVWEDIVLGSILPDTAFEKGSIHTNTEETLWMDLNNAEKSDYSSYLAQCKEKGFTIDPTTIGDSYTAYNGDGYKLKIDYNEYDEYISINLDAPMKTKDLKWPINDLCELLPTPKSTKGKIEWEHEDKFLVYLADMTIDDFADYADACRDKGFNVDYDRGDTHYYAENKDGYDLSLEYEGFNTIYIRLEAPQKDTESSVVESKEEKPESKETESKEDAKITNGDFKKAMDEYEEFMDEYVEFMKKYQESDGTDLSLLTDYAQYMSDYAEMAEAFDNWEDEELSDDELAYYIEVQARVTKKLLEVSQ